MQFLNTFQNSALEVNIVIPKFLFAYINNYTDDSQKVEPLLIPNLALTWTKIDFPQISIIHLLQFYPR